MKKSTQRSYVLNRHAIESLNRVIRKATKKSQGVTDRRVCSIGGLAGFETDKADMNGNQHGTTPA